MYGQGQPLPPGVRGAAPPPRQPMQQHFTNTNNTTTNNNLFQNHLNPYLLHQHLYPQINPYLQNPSPFQPHYPANRFPPPPNHTPATSTAPSNNLIVENLDKAAVKAHRELLSSKESVSAWKVSQAALLAVHAESWESLGVQMQQVPSLNRLLVTAGKINAFIHCFVAARGITSLYDMEREICESEGVKKFEELELGPLVRHPLVVHYFGVTSDVKEVYRITTEEIVAYLSEFLETHKKKDVNTNTFLEFISKKNSVNGIGKLCVRIQNFGLYISKIKEVRRSEDTLLTKCFEKIKTRVDKKSKKRPLFSAQKKQLDDHFSAISQRIKAFSTENTIGGQHTIFVSSSSEEDDSEDNKEENNARNKTLPQSNIKSDHVSTCPYPSATEEKTRLGLKSDTDFSSSAPDGGARYNVENEAINRKRRSENVASTNCSSRKLQRRDKVDVNHKHKSSEKEGNQEIDGYALSNEALQSFITTWKEACRSNNATEVLERMLQVYNVKKKKKVKALFTTFPFIGLLKAAVLCINSGMWDNMYDTFQASDQQGGEINKPDSSDDYISIAVEPANEVISAPKLLRNKVDVTAEDIVKDITGYLVDGMECNGLTGENKLSFLGRICKCQNWLIKHYSVSEFESLGYGEYFSFIEKYVNLLPHGLQKFLIGGTYEDVALDARLLPLQLDVLLSQAFSSFWENKNISLQSVSELLARQFPLVCMKLLSSHLAENSVDILREKVCKVTSNCVLFSTPLLKLKSPADSTILKEKKLDGTSGYDYNVDLRGIGPFTTKDPIEVLLKAPMLIDLNLWLHWDLSFAPSLGSIVEWLLKEVNNKELLCLVTKDGKVIRLDNSATPDSFLKVFIRGSSFETAVQLLSLYAIYGGEQNVPLSLLKCHAVKAFEVIINNSMEMESDSTNSLPRDMRSCDQHTANSRKYTPSNLDRKLFNNSIMPNEADRVVSRFIIDCLSYLPIEFCSFAADVLISGAQSFIKGVPLTILNECKQIEQRLILHEVGLSLGMVEWINDSESLLSSSTSGFSSASSCLDTVASKFNSNSGIKQNVLNKRPSSGELVLASEADPCELIHRRAGDGAELSDDLASKTDHLSGLDSAVDNNPVRVITSIREDEFGLNESLSVTENSMLEKQHARLGRALHCLSQELYSQDSHFLLELVQNADDNIYPGTVEPTLTFILQETGIIILNNEKGFSADNIRALCDVGNSTKKGHSAGYIGKKGIGFKSVFRVTDAPEIHSNGYHIKFDITEGQIGFVLPTIVPARDTDLYSRLAAGDADCMDQRSCNTCIVLPFRSNLGEGFSMNNIISMFSDLHPSLLLFLHRLQCIKFRNLLDDSLIVMRKEVLGDGMVQVALGNERMSWLVVSQQLEADVIRSDVPTTEISLAFTLQETDDGGYAPILKQQPVFAYLPLRTYGLKFILQGDFVLPSSREEVDGNSPWNQWLLSEFPDLFLSAERSFCDLPCYRENIGKAVTAFMSFIPLVGEVHGFFSSLPRMIVSKLRMSNCLILEGIEKEWVPPCKVLRNWSEQTRSLLPDSFLQEHLGLGYLNKDIILSDALARALGIEDYGPKVVLRVISSLSRSENVLKSMGLSWLSSFLSDIYVMLCHSATETSPNYLSESDFILSLKKIPFIPVLNGKFCSADEETMWLHIEEAGHSFNDGYVLNVFPRLYTQLQIVSPNLLTAAASDDNSCSGTTIAENVIKLLYKLGIQRLSAHEIVKAHILPALSNLKTAAGEENLMVEYLSFVMFHLQSSCTTCSQERDGIITELHEKALILTNYGYKRSIDVPIHFSPEYRSSIDVNRLVGNLDMEWHEVDTKYLKHSITNTLSDGVLKWRTFFQDIGVTDFTRLVQVEKRVADMHWIDRGAVSVDFVVKDWESDELLHLLSQLTSKDNRKKSIYLMEILDTLWNSYFSDKVAVHCIDSIGECKSFKSSVLNMLQDVPWIVSSMDNKLHYAKDLFHGCASVSSLLGASAPYSVPKVRNEKLVADIGLKTQVTSDDALHVLQLWRRTQPPLKASLSQMSNFYGFLWKETTISQKRIIKDLLSGPFIFVPCTSSCSLEEAVPGQLLSCQEVYWHDSTASPGFMADTSTSSIGKMLCNFYPTLRNFFVNECGVMENPPLRGYLQILLQLSRTMLPHEAAKRVFEVFIRWADALKTGLLSLEDVDYLKESLLKKDCTVLPTKQDKWVSLHSSFGLVCWYDDDKLGKEFKNVEGVDFLYFGNYVDKEKQMIHAEFVTIMQKLGIPALSEIVTREAISSRAVDSSCFYSLMNRILPYAQRYFINSHPSKYIQLKQSDFEILRRLKIVVVEELFYQNVIKRCEITSKEKKKCGSLLQDNVLYCSTGSRRDDIFSEFSRLLYNGTTDVHFANFLLVIAAEVESGSPEQTESFMLNSQKIPKLPAEESPWFLQPVLSSAETNATLVENYTPQKVEVNKSVFQGRYEISSNWPSADWRSAPGFSLKQAAPVNMDITVATLKLDDTNPTDIRDAVNTEGDQTVAVSRAAILESDILETPFNHSSNRDVSAAEVELHSVGLNALDGMNFVRSNSNEGNSLSAHLMQRVGREGESVAFNYFLREVGGDSIRWVNETCETGLPYDIILGTNEKNRQYIEVKATTEPGRKWFYITKKEWEFAVEKGESFSIAHVNLSNKNQGQCTIEVYKNPYRWCELGRLKLAMAVV